MKNGLIKIVPPTKRHLIVMATLYGVKVNAKDTKKELQNRLINAFRYNPYKEVRRGL